MKIAIVGDIHSNITALEQVLRDIETRDVDSVIGTGDLVGYLPYPNEVIDKVRSSHILCVQGNHDYKIAYSESVSYEEVKYLEPLKLQEKASLIYTNLTITDENREYLKAMPQQIQMKVAGRKIIVVHGSPFGMNEYMHKNPDLLKEMSAKVQEDIVICGHTHVPYIMEVNQVTFVNAGSVGKPKHGNGNATYVILDITKEGVQSEIVEVPYEKETLIARIKEEVMISDELVDMLEQGY